MKLIKKIFLVFIISLLFFPSIIAQNTLKKQSYVKYKTNFERIAAEITQNLMKEISLTDFQSEEMKMILKDYQRNYNPDKKQRNEIKLIADIENILNENQKSEWMNVKSEWLIEFHNLIESELNKNKDEIRIRVDENGLMGNSKLNC
jgi:hypothetical protein